MEYIITFINTNHAIKAEQGLLKKNINVGVLPLPSQISAGCGISLRVGLELIKPALAALADMNIDGIRLYTRTNKNGHYLYTEVKDNN
jgi:hypothetical protein